MDAAVVVAAEEVDAEDDDRTNSAIGFVSRRKSFSVKNWVNGECSSIFVG